MSSYIKIYRAKSTDRDKLTAKQWFLYMFSSLISSQSEGFGKMALGIVKIYFKITLLSQSALFAVSLSRSVVVDPYLQAGKYVACLYDSVLYICAVIER